MSRLILLYGDRLEKDASKAIYRLVHDCYDDTGLRKVEHREGGKEYYTYEKGKGLISFPFAFEIIAIPFTQQQITQKLNSLEPSIILFLLKRMVIFSKVIIVHVLIRMDITHRPKYHQCFGRTELS